ncbi:MAG TPA: hypothetical protein VIA06_22850 [Candidatus Dormibacteraeota bacterium]|nr:hypothetical protein [Candidatus Dormibacteraeota bacterium]
MERDAHGWLEQEGPRTLEWQANLDAAARDYIHGLAVYPPLEAQLRRFQPSALVFPRRVGQRWARRRQETNTVEMAGGGTGPWSPLPDLARRIAPISVNKFNDGGACSLLRHILNIAAGQAPMPDDKGLEDLFTAPCRMGVASAASGLARIPTLIGRADLVAAYAWRRGWRTAIVRSENGTWWWVTCGADPEGRRISLLSIVRSWGVFSPHWHLVDYVPSPRGTYVALLLACGSPETPGPGRIRTVETASGRVLTEVVEAGPWPQMAWLPDESGFLYNGPDPGSGGIGLWSHVLGERSQPIRPAAPVVEAVPARPVISPSGRWLGLHGWGRLHAVLDRSGVGEWIAMDPTSAMARSTATATWLWIPPRRRRGGSSPSHSPAEPPIEAGGAS